MTYSKISIFFVGALLGSIVTVVIFSVLLQPEKKAEDVVRSFLLAIESGRYDKANDYCDRLLNLKSSLDSEIGDVSFRELASDIRMNFLDENWDVIRVRYDDDFQCIVTVRSGLKKFNFFLSKPEKESEWKISLYTVTTQ